MARGRPERFNIPVEQRINKDESGRLIDEIYRGDTAACWEHPQHLRKQNDKQRPTPVDRHADPSECADSGEMIGNCVLFDRANDPKREAEYQTRNLSENGQLDRDWETISKNRTDGCAALHLV